MNKYNGRKITVTLRSRAL